MQKQRRRTPPPSTRAKSARRWNGFAPDKHEQHESKRVAILQQAARLFDERGYYETSLADIAASLHVTKPTLYYYVANKEDIVTQIIEQAALTVETHAAAARSGGANALERLRAFARDYVELINTEFGRCLLGMRRVPTSAATRTRTSAAYRRIDAIGRELIAEGIADGSIRDCDVRLASFALFGAINWTPNWFHPDEALSAAAAGDALFDIFERGLANPGSSSSSLTGRQPKSGP
jgi:AcrR family transcriptional regulator